MLLLLATLLGLSFFRCFAPANKTRQPSCQLKKQRRLGLGEVAIKNRLQPMAAVSSERRGEKKNQQIIHMIPHDADNLYLHVPR